MTEYTPKLEWDLLGRITMQALCNATGETQADITIEELTALLKEKIRLQEELKTAKAEAWDDGEKAGINNMTPALAKLNGFKTNPYKEQEC